MSAVRCSNVIILLSIMFGKSIYHCLRNAAILAPKMAVFYFWRGLGGGFLPRCRCTGRSVALRGYCGPIVARTFCGTTTFLQLSECCMQAPSSTLWGNRGGNIRVTRTSVTQPCISKSGTPCAPSCRSTVPLRFACLP